jgi:hypothetical protein
MPVNPGKKTIKIETNIPIEIHTNNDPPVAIIKNDIAIPVENKVNEKVSKTSKYNLRDRHWMITIFNYNDTVNGKTKLENIYSLKSFIPKQINSLAFQCEICPTTGRKHLHLYIEFVKIIRFNAVKLFLNDITGIDTHIELKYDKSNKEACIKYCSKKEDFDSEVNIREKFGNCEKKKKEKSNLRDICDKLKNGESMKKAIEDYPEDFVRNHRGLQALSNMHDTPRDKNNKAIVELYFGDSGTGKSRKAFDSVPVGEFYFPNCEGNIIWFDGYDNKTHKLVIFDDFISNIPFHVLLKLLDRYPYQAQIKGGQVQFKPEKIIMTSNISPMAWYQKMNLSKEQRIALIRRFDLILQFKKEKPNEPDDVTEEMKRLANGGIPKDHQLGYYLDGCDLNEEEDKT